MNVAASAALLLLVLGFAGGAWHPWSPNIPAIIPAGRFPVMAGLLLLTVACARSLLSEHRLPRLKELTSPTVWSLGLVAFFFSDWVVRPWGFFPDPFSRGPIIVGALVCAWFLTVRWTAALKLWALASIVLIAAAFFAESQGRLLMADDHAMFLFRLKLLKEHFPAIPFWSPLWNAGFDARDFFATGALNAFLISAPLVYLFPVESVYNLIIAGILWGLVPACSFAASRLLGGKKTTAWLAAALSVAVSLLWYRWALKYGTVGFMTSSALFPLVFALSLRFIESPKPRWRDCLALVVSATLMFLWSPSALAVLPLGVLVILRLPRLILSPRHITTALLIVCLNLPWVSMMWTVSKVGNFLNAEGSGAPSTIQASVEEGTQPKQEAATGDAPEPFTPPTTGPSFRHRAGKLDLRRGMQELHSQAQTVNPLLALFAVPAILALGGRKRLAYALSAGWLLFLGTFGVSLKPQLELDRMATMAAMLAAAPVAAYLYNLFEAAKTSFWHRAAAVAAGGFLLASPLAASTVVQNHSSERYQFRGQEMTSLTEFLSGLSTSGRVLFSGCILHEIDGAHIAPVALWTNKQLLATSYAHNIWQYTQPIPRDFLLRKDDGIREWLDLMNVTVIFAHEPTWVEYFRKRPSEYREIYAGSRLFAFERVAYSPTFFLQGEGSDYTFTSGSVTFTPKTERVVLKLQHFPFLSSSGCKLSAFEAAPGVSLVELSSCTPGQPVTIKSVSPLDRLFSKGARTT